MSRPNPKLILASASKRRSQILRSCRIPHTVIVSKIKEKIVPKINPSELVILNAKLKAKDIAERLEYPAIILGVDTLVFFKGRPIGKPRSKKEAKEMLRSFSGNSILVYTGLCIVDKYKNKNVTTSDKTKIRVKNICEYEIDRYFVLLKPYDKAGGFSIEGIGSILFDDIEGAYFNVLGLPMGKLEGLFRKVGYSILDFIIDKS